MLFYYIQNYNLNYEKRLLLKVKTSNIYAAYIVLGISAG
ncbi:hypothetical protein NOC27_1567 [Nitrosococcus oceani AFC27]|nr:hypothetical protein NOC27_1567 [Nitrosococcus oceani AFC27]